MISYRFHVTTVKCEQGLSQSFTARGCIESDGRFRSLFDVMCRCETSDGFLNRKPKSFKKINRHVGFLFASLLLIFDKDVYETICKMDYFLLNNKIHKADDNIVSMWAGKHCTPVLLSSVKNSAKYKFTAKYVSLKINQKKLYKIDEIQFCKTKYNTRQSRDLHVGNLYMRSSLNTRFFIRNSFIRN